MRKLAFGLIMCCLAGLWSLDQGELFLDTFEILGEWTPVNGDWQTSSGAMVQLDARDTVTHIYRIVKQNGIMEYNFELFYLDGFTDGYGGVGIHLCIDKPTTSRSWGNGQSYLLWLTYDEKAYGSSDFFAQLYKSRGAVSMNFWHMQKGDEYPVPRDVLTPAQFAAGDRLTIRLILDLSSGQGRFYHPRDAGYYFPIDIGIPPAEGLYISLRTNSLAVGVDNFKVTHLGE